MKYIVVILFACLALSSCKTISYESAVNSNKDKFYGDDEKTALLITDFKDVSQISADISGLAKDQAYSKDLCDFADMVISDQHKQNVAIKILALKKGIKLPNVVGGNRQKIYHQMQSILDEKSFDKIYYENMKNLYSSTISRCDSFLDKKQEGPVRDFIAKQSGIFKDYVKKIDQLQTYMDKVEPQQITEK